MSTSFLMFPRVFLGKDYASLSLASKVLYALLWERYQLSLKNNFEDKSNNTIVYFTNREACEKLNYAHQKVSKCFKELEQIGLIERKKQGKGYPDIIRVKSLVECEKAASKSAEKPRSRKPKSSTLERDKTAHNYINNSYIKSSYINQSIYAETEERIKTQLEYDILIERGYGSIADEIVNLLTDTLCSESETIKIGQKQISTETVRYRFSKLTCEHIEEVINRLEHTQPKIQNGRAYMLTMLYNIIDTYEIESLYGN